MKKVLFLTVLFLIPLFSINAYGNSANPGPPPVGHLSGPAVLATLTVTVSDVSGPCSDSNPGTFCPLNVQIGSGNCKGEPVQTFSGTFLSSHDFLDLTGEDFEGEPLGPDTLGFLPANCPPNHVIDWRIQTVTKFTRIGDSEIRADVVILFIVEK